MMTPSSFSHADSATLVRVALSDLITAGLATFADWLKRGAPAPVDYSDPRIIDRDDNDDYTEGTALIDAAALLGVRVGASADEVRAAFRRAVKAEIARDSAFHDHGGDSTDPRAQRLIAAKNLLIDHARQEMSDAV